MYDKLIIFLVLEITRRIIDILLNETRQVIFSCEVTGEPVPTISWLFNGKKIKENDTVNYYISVCNNKAVNMSNLIFPSKELSNIGVYTCEANNTIYHERSSAALTIISELHKSCIIMLAPNDIHSYR